jgi:hypothetical protein
MLVLEYSSTIKMEAVDSSAMSVNLYWTTQYHIPEESTLHNTTLRASIPTIIKFVVKKGGCRLDSNWFRIGSSNKLLCTR